MAQKFDADFPKGSPYDAVSCIRSDAEYLAQLRSKCSTWLDFTSIVKRMNGDGMQQPGFGARIGLAFGAFFKILFNGEYAASILAIAGRSNDTVEMPGLTADTVPADPIQAVTATEPIPPSEDTAPTEDPMQAERKALQLIGALQREGRFIDFLMEDLNAAADADIGAAARVVHGGCKKVVDSYLTIEQVWPGDEGTRVTVDEGFDAQRITLTGNVSGTPPFSGTLQHPGWRVSEAKLPELSDSAEPHILMPAEIEL